MQSQVPSNSFCESVPLVIPLESLRPLIETVLTSTGALAGWPVGRVALQEAEAAECIGVAKHVLRDVRLRKKLPHTLVGRSVTYTPTQLRCVMETLSVNK